MAEMESIGELCQLINGYAFKPSDWSSDGTPIVRIQNLNNILAGFNYFKGKLAEKYYIDNGALLFSWSGTPGTSFGAFIWNRGPAIINQHIFRVIPKKRINIFYLKYAINGKLSDIIAKSHGGVGLQHITKKDLEKITILIPSFDVQNKIVMTLNSLEDILEKRKQQLSKLDQLVKSRFVEMFGDENSFHNWVTCKVDSIAEICVGIVIKPSQYYTLDIESGVKAFRSLNIREMYIKNKDWVYLTKAGHQKNQKSIVKENDVLIVRSGSPGTACVATKEYVGYNAIDIIIAHPNCKKINPVFLAMFTNMPHGMNQIRENTGGAAQQHFNVGGYKNITIILPPLPLQEQFAAFVQQVEKAKSSVNLSLEKLETLKKSLMQEYLG